MVNQQPECIFDENGILQKGIIIRHMLIPGNLHDSKKVLSYLYGEYSNSVYYSLMSQYTPVKKHKYEELNRKVTTEEYEELVDFAFSLGIRNCYIQETEAANESFIPDFSDNSII
jgi:putative pyruvate formate lyase activating enzyme